MGRQDGATTVWLRRIFLRLGPPLRSSGTGKLNPVFRSDDESDGILA